MTLLYLPGSIVALELLVYLGIALLKMRCVLPSVVLALVIVVLPVGVFAQQTIFNVPSADVLDAGKVYLETDQYFRPWKTDSDDAAFFFMRGVVGVGANVELGLNAGPFDYIHQNNPFIVFAGKWRLVLLEFGDAQKPGALGLYGGAHLGVGLGGDVVGDFHAFTYGEMALTVPGLGTRLGVGPYYATRAVFGVPARGGVLATFEQKIPGIDGLMLAADWLSGRGGYVTPGFIYSRGPWIFYLGYGLANTGRDDDLVTLEVGLTVR